MHFLLNFVTRLPLQTMVIGQSPDVPPPEEGLVITINSDFVVTSRGTFVSFQH